MNFAVVVFIVEPGQPSEVNVYAFAKYILVTWEPPLEPNGIITKYRVGSAVNTGSEDVVVDKEEVGNSVRRKLLENQEPEKNYVVEIQAATSKGWGEIAKKTTTTVKLSGKLLNCNIPESIEARYWKSFKNEVKC